MSEVLERVYNRARSEEVVPEIRAAVARASDRPEMERFLKKLSGNLTLVEEDEDGLSRMATACARRWFTHFSGVPYLLTPDSVSPLRENSMSLMGKRARPSGLSVDPERGLLK